MPKTPDLYSFNEVSLTYKPAYISAYRPEVRTARDAFNILNEYWSDQIGIQEEFNMLFLDRSNRAMGIFNLAKGGISSVQVDKRLAFACALKARANSLILAHNHPSGNLKPSQKDKSLTSSFQEAGKLLDISILDHLILSPDGGYFSFADEYLL